MKCPACGCHIELSQERYQARMRALGLCVTCAEPNDSDHYQCRDCRLRRAARERRRYLRRTRADIPEQRA
jgi:hypothetical protein